MISGCRFLTPHRRRVFLTVILPGICVPVVFLVTSVSADPAGSLNKVRTLESADEVNADQNRVASQFLKVLLANPRFGTSFDRVREFHVDRGSIREFEESLCRTAGL